VPLVRRTSPAPYYLSRLPTFDPALPVRTRPVWQFLLELGGVDGGGFSFAYSVVNPSNAPLPAINFYWNDSPADQAYSYQPPDPSARRQTPIMVTVKQSDLVAQGMHPSPPEYFPMVFSVQLPDTLIEKDRPPNTLNPMTNPQTALLRRHKSKA